MVDGLSQRIVDLLLKAGHDDEAFAEVKQVAVEGQTPLQRLWAVDWLIKQSAWDEVADLTNVKNFNENALLLYRLAEAALRSGAEAEAESLAEKAFGLAGAGTAEDYPVLFNSVLMTWLRQDDTNTRRLAMASALAENRGMIDWAIREYRESATTEDPQLLRSSTRQLSLLLHDHQRDEEAAKVRQDAIDRTKEDKGFADYFKGEYESAMHYFRACRAKRDGKFDEEVEHLKKAIKADPNDVEALIALYRANGADEALKKSNQKQIRRVAATFMNRIRVYEARLKSRSPNQAMLRDDLIFDENQYAWLIGNTEGDIDEAIRRSEHTVRERPANGGIRRYAG